MAKIRIIAVEDDPLHEEKLRMHIEKLGYDLVTVLCDPKIVLSSITAIHPDVILMDIDLSNEVSGIDLVSVINTKFDIPIVYLTSFIDNRTFQQAKKTSPSAYVTKPYKMIELQSAIELALNNKDRSAYELLGNTNKITEGHFFIKDNGSLHKIAITDVQLVEAYDKYCNIYTTKKKHMLRVSLKELAGQLPPSQFCQTHRSYIVALNAIEAINVGTGTINIADKKIPISKSFKEALFSRLNSLG